MAQPDRPHAYTHRNGDTITDTYGNPEPNEHTHNYTDVDPVIHTHAYGASTHCHPHADGRTHVHTDGDTEPALDRVTVDRSALNALRWAVIYDTGEGEFWSRAKRLIDSADR